MYSLAYKLTSYEPRTQLSLDESVLFNLPWLPLSLSQPTSFETTSTLQA